MLAVIGNRTFRSVAQLTDQNAETVRRYLNGASPSIEFLEALCKRLDLNAHWLLTGQGVPNNSETRSHALKEANPSELLSAVAMALEALTGRVDRIEAMVNTIDVRLNARAGSAVLSATASHADHSTDKPGTIKTKPSAVADAVAKRPPSAAG